MLGFALLIFLFGILNGWEPTAQLLCAAALHECGHLALLRSFGAAVRGARFSPLGVEILADCGGLSYPQELLTVLAGPAVNLLCGAACAGAARLWGEPALFAPAGAHLVLGAFNLLPLRPLDGGRAIFLLLSWIAGPAAGDLCARAAGAVVSAVGSAALVMLMIATGGNLWLAPAVAGLAACGARELFGTIRHEHAANLSN
jgi:stage IV sporulation protein FB